MRKAFGVYPCGKPSPGGTGCGKPSPEGVSKVKACTCGKLSPRGISKVDPRGKGSHGGTRKVYRAGSLPPGEEARQGVPVRKAHPWRNKQSAHRAERLPLGNRQGVSAREKCASLGKSARFTRAEDLQDVPVRKAHQAYPRGKKSRKASPEGTRKVDPRGKIPIVELKLTLGRISKVYPRGKSVEQARFARAEGLQGMPTERLPLGEREKWTRAGNISMGELARCTRAESTPHPCSAQREKV